MPDLPQAEGLHDGRLSCLREFGKWPTDQDLPDRRGNASARIMGDGKAYKPLAGEGRSIKSNDSRSAKAQFIISNS